MKIMLDVPLEEQDPVGIGQLRSAPVTVEITLPGGKRRRDRVAG